MRISDWSSDVCSSDLSIIGTRHVAIALSAGTLCHCIVFVPNLFGERNFLSIYLSQIAITISVSLLASWLVAVSLIPMLSARLKTPPAVQKSGGLIHKMQVRYARFLRWTLEHRGKSLLGIALIVAVSFRSEEHTSELQSLMRNSYAVICLQKTKLH